jgi:hypothetical protein
MAEYGGPCTTPHEEPYTIHEVVLMERLRRRGIPEPSFATRKETLAWLEKWRHLVEDKE